MLAACRVHICYDVHICLPSMFSRSVVLPWQYRVDLVVLKRVSNVDIAVQRDWDNRQCVCHHQSPWLNIDNVFVTFSHLGSTLTMCLSLCVLLAQR